MGEPFRRGGVYTLRFLRHPFSYFFFIFSSSPFFPQSLSCCCLFLPQLLCILFLLSSLLHQGIPSFIIISFLPLLPEVIFLLVFHLGSLPLLPRTPVLFYELVKPPGHGPMFFHCLLLPFLLSSFIFLLLNLNFLPPLLVISHFPLNIFQLLGYLFLLCWDFLLHPHQVFLSSPLGPDVALDLLQFLRLLPPFLLLRLLSFCSGEFSHHHGYPLLLPFSFTQLLLLLSPSQPGYSL